MQEVKQQRRWGLTGFIMITVTILVAAFLILMSQRKFAVTVLVNSEKFAAVGAMEKLEFAINMGKPIEHFYGAKDILVKTQKISDNIIAIWLANSDGALLYSSVDDIDITPYRLKDDALYQEIDGNIYCEQTLDSGISIGILINNSLAFKWTFNFLCRLILYVTIAIFLSAVFLSVFANRYKKKAVIIIMIATQICFFVFVSSLFKECYSDSLLNTEKIIKGIIASDIDKLGNFGIRPEEFVGFNEYLSDINEQIPELSHIQMETKPQTEYLDLSAGGMGIYGVIDQSIVHNTLIGYAVQTVGLIATTIFIVLEILFYMNHSVDSNANVTLDNMLPSMRLLFFTLYAGVNMSTSFIAPMSQQLAFDSGFGDSIWGGIPVTAEILAGVVAMLLSGKIIEKLGYSSTLRLCLGICICGIVLSGVVFHILLFTLARMIVGFGFALSTITGRVICNAQSNSEVRSQMLANLIGGTLIGLCCGTVIGGLLSDYYGYTAVFLLSAVILLICFPMAKNASYMQRADAFKLSNMYKLFRTPGILLYLSLMVFPIYACGAFVTFYMPIYGVMNGMSKSIISALIMANCLIAAYLAPFSEKFVRRYLSLDTSVILYGLMNVAAITLGIIYSNTFTIICAVFIMGVADSFGLVLLVERFAGKHGGTEKMMSVTIAGRAGQSVAPSMISSSGGSPFLLAIITASGIIAYLLLKKRISSNLGD